MRRTLDNTLPVASSADRQPVVTAGSERGNGPALAALASGSRSHLLMAAVALFAIYTIWGSTYLAIRYVVEALPPFTMAGLRFVLAAAVLFGWLRLRGGGEPIAAVHWRSAAIFGTLLLLGGNGLVCWAEKHVPSGIAAVLVATVPLWFVSFEWAFFRGAAPRIETICGIAAGLLGVVLLINPFAVAKVGEHATRVHPGGAIALLSACTFWAWGSLYSRRAPLPKSAVLVTAMQMLCGGGALLAAGALLGEFTQIYAKDFTTRSVLAFFYLVTFGSLIGFTAYSWLLKNVPPAVASTYAFVNPVVAILLAWAVGETQLTPRTVIAIGVILVGVVVITLAPKGKPRTAT